MRKYKLSEINQALREVQMDLLHEGIKPEQFDMSVTKRETCSIDRSCNTAGCIGGHVAMYLGLNSQDNVDHFVGSAATKSMRSEKPLFSKKAADKLTGLFYPEYLENEDWSKLTIPQAVVAIERYFNGAKQPWKGLD